MPKQVLWLILAMSVLLMSCRHAAPPTPPDHPRLAPGVALRDVTFHSNALNRDMHYRMLLPEVISRGDRVAVIYLLHGGGGSYLDWTNYTDISQFVLKQFVFVLPEGDDSYYMNSATRPQDKYEDYITRDLIADAESRFPAVKTREGRGIAGVSMGGFGAITLGLRHPDLYVFVGAMSAALDVPSRPFSIKRIDQWRHHRSIFGDWKSQEQRSRDPYVIAQSADPGKAPYIFFTCGDKEGLLAANRKFDFLLKSRGFNYEFYQVAGGHEWRQWVQQFPSLFKQASEHLAPSG
jgi:putative tributyrin esterase